MQMLKNQQTTVLDSLELELAYQDRLIGNRLPTWFRSADADLLTALGGAMRQSLIFHQRVTTALARIQGIDSFAISVLEATLKERFNDVYTVRRWSLRLGRRQPVINQQPVGIHLTEVVYEEIPLIEAALRNFTAAEAEADGQPSGNCLISFEEQNNEPPTAIAFAGLCREIDIGGQYQRYLDTVLHAGAEGRVDSVSALLASSQRCGMLVDAYEARIKGVLSDDELQLVIGLCNEGNPGRLDGDPVVAKQVSFLGCDLEQIVVLDVIDEGVLRNTTRRVLLHIPGDPHGAWSAFDSLRALANEVGRRLRTEQYQRFFSRFIRRRNSQRFFSTVIPAYADLVMTANFDLEEHMHAYPMPLFDNLAMARIRQIKDDAAMIAIPIAELDREIQREHDQRLAAEGWTLLNVAGFFVPLIGAALFAVTAWKMLGEVYHGIAAWRDGDTSEALDHLINVGTDLALIGATAAGVSTARRLWSRSSMVDSLVPAYLEDGTVKLWNQDMTVLRSEAPPPEAVRDAQGIYSHADHSWIEIDGHYYSVVQRASDEQWQLRPREGHGPLLRHNGAGAWRLWCEQPAEWGDTYQMFRRLGGSFGELDDEQIDQVLNIHGLTADHLRGLHVHAQAPSPALLDSVLRITLDQRIRNVISSLRAGEPAVDTTVFHHVQALPEAAELSDQDLAELAWQDRRRLFQRLYDSVQSSDAPGVAALRRDFPSLHRLGATELVRMASAADRQRLLDTGRVPLRLAELARASVTRIRVVRVYESFVVDTPQNADSARVALGMLKHLAGFAVGIRWRLIEGHANGPQILSIREGAQSFSLIHQSGKFQLLDARGALVGASGELFEVMATAYDDSQRIAMGIGDPFAHNLRVLLGRQAVQRRHEVEGMLSVQEQIGWFRPPQHLPDGRIGYPLSGRSPAGSPGRVRPRSMHAMVRSLYPTFSDAQVTSWLSDIQDSGRLVEQELMRLTQELETLNRHLCSWLQLGRTATERDTRRYFIESLVACWQRRVNGFDIGEQPQVYRYTLHGIALSTLPDLPEQVTFAHVSELALLGMDLSMLPDSFLRAFPNVWALELSGNRLSRLPLTLMQLRNLRELDLFNNQIVLDPAQATILAMCESLEYVSLSYNPLGRPFSLTGLRRLRRLHLRHTGIRELPNALPDCPNLVLADLRDNQITQLPQPFYQAPAQIRRAIILTGNPLAALEAERLRASLLDAGSAQAEIGDAEDLGAVRQRWLDAAESLARSDMSVWWELVETQQNASDFFNMLGRLLETADFQHSSQALANRVFTMIKAMLDSASLRKELFNQVTENLTCQDSVALCFSNLELRMLVWRAEVNADDREGALLHLGRQLWRLDEVDRIALEDIRARRASGGNPDEIEVALAYRLALRDVLDLPAQPTDMLYGEIAGVDSQRIAHAQAAVEEAETPEQLARSLVVREFWREYLLRTHRARFDAIDAPFHERLMVVMDSETIVDGERIVQVNRIQEERLAAQRALMHELTLTALETTAVPAPGIPR